MHEIKNQPKKDHETVLEFQEKKYKEERCTKIVLLPKNYP